MDRLMLVERRPDGVVVLTLNRPRSRNALSIELRRQLIDVVRALDEDDAVRAIVLTGSNPAFCSGVDLRESMQSGELSREPTNPATVLRRTSTPVVCAVNGACVTGGLEVALSCSFILASDRARFADTHAKVGLVPGWGGSALLPMAVGTRFARQMMLTGEFIDAATALRVGLANEVVPHEQLLERAVAVAAMVSATPPEPRRTLLRLLDDGDGATLARRVGLESDMTRTQRHDASGILARFEDGIRGEDQ